MVLALLNANRLVPNLLHLIRGVGHLVLGGGSERQRINWVLWVLFVENVSITILPVGVVHLITARQVHWSFAEGVAEVDEISTLALLTIVYYPLSCVHVHFVGVDNFTFLLHIKSLLVVLGIGTLTLELLLVE